MESMTALHSFFAVLVLLFSALAISSPAPDPLPQLNPPGYLDDVSFVFADPWPARAGLAPHVGLGTLQLRKRQCFENGSNYCFEDETQFCPDCGGCCSEGSDTWCCAEESANCCPGQTCCGAEENCCGEGCCEKGRKCTNGKCEVPIVTTTSTKTVLATKTHTEVEVVTVQMKVEVTSTINSVVVETVTSADGTQTDITYVTTTLREEKRSLPTNAAYLDRREQEDRDASGVPSGVLSEMWRRLVFGGHTQRPEFDERGLPASPTEARHCSATPLHQLERRQNDDTSTTTVVVTTTIETKTTVKDRRTTTDFVTSTSETTVYQTSTRVIGAKATVSRTVTVTITSKPPTTQTITSTSTSLIGPTDAAQTGGLTPSDDPPPASESRRKGLSTAAIAGIGAGSGLAALALGAVLFLLWRRNKRKMREQADIPYDYVIAPAPAPIPSRHRAASDLSYAGAPGSPKYGFGGGGAAKISPAGSPPHSRGHSRSLSAATTQVSYGEPGGRGSWVPGSIAEAPGDSTAPPQMRTIPHPNTSSVGRTTRFAELDGSGGGGRLL